MSNSPLEIGTAEVPDQQTHYGNPFPLAYVCSTPDATLNDTLTWTRANTGKLTAQAAEHGAVFFRGLPLVTPEDFDAFVAAFNLPTFAYNESYSNAVRINYTPRVFSANEAPPEVNINLHHEMLQSPLYPI